MQVSNRWIENPTFLAESDGGHSVTIDGPESEGGRNKDISPMELMLMGIGGRTSVDVIKILKKARKLLRVVSRASRQREAVTHLVFLQIFTHIF